MIFVSLPPYKVGGVFSPSQFKALAETDDWGYKFIDPQAFHKLGFKGKAVHFVIDTADYSDHPDVEPKLIKSLCKSFVQEAVGDFNGHGTWVASRIAAKDDGNGVRGIAPDSMIALVKGLNGSGGGTDLSVADSINYVANVVLPAPYTNYPKIINMSLGSSQPMATVESALKNAVAKGCIVVAAAGNSGFQEGKNSMSYPARYDDLALAVGALDSNGNPAPFSSGGNEMDFSAPGVNLYGAWKDKTYVSISGTSMATPAVAGIIDLLIQRYNIPVNQASIEQALKKYAQDIFTPGWDVRTGDGTFVLTKLTDQPPTDSKFLVEFTFPFVNAWPMMFAGNGSIVVKAAVKETDNFESLWTSMISLIRPYLARHAEEPLKTIALKIKGATFAEQVSIDTGRIKITV